MENSPDGHFLFSCIHLAVNTFTKWFSVLESLIINSFATVSHQYGHIFAALCLQRLLIPCDKMVSCITGSSYARKTEIFISLRSLRSAWQSALFPLKTWWHNRHRKSTSVQKTAHWKTSYCTEDNWWLSKWKMIWPSLKPYHADKIGNENAHGHKSH